ncbi:ADP-ribose pyrophosphatase [Streptococcus azizii]|uniref:ADP-ribose pyrophosphatase n=1 Tax=Streptococcus azizii TaxID=1579424 RepID=A0AB36JQM8_9STRE|nr:MULTISPECIES: NUDIX hydrolase [Streptococcus]MBF0776731.1 NUDIX hydrolase [Streptococcus sp. 19428wD3_AN2]ONK27535.1 ADP-ribose pyrophosphatase [Streptococcus azizii]ONK27656.1 ADP-ribose pyrophosphatase [Streptococcus azizii]ONK29836.1 ADP-ribose pyrophosphatase [Streptococcus azizii]TFU82469.1 NUDIX domain-containing protein [Streptococcus sp. AN2]
MTRETNWLKWAVRLQALAQAGLAYSKDVYDIERFEEIRQIAAEMLVEPSGLPLAQVEALFCNESGYQTPKLDTRAAIIEGQKILLVQENDGLWSLPGGWCDVDQSTMENTVKEVREEAGLDVEVVRLVAVLDKMKSNPSRSAHHVTKVFYLCRSLGGQFQANSETLTSAYFSLGDLPTLSLGKNTVEQIALCFEAYQAEHWETRFE